VVWGERWLLMFSGLSERWLLMFSGLRWEVVVRFVHIGEIVDYHCLNFLLIMGDRRGRGRMVVWFTTTYAIGVYHHWVMSWVRIPLRARCITLCDKVCQWLAAGRWFPPGTPVSSTSKTDRHDITEILLKVALNTIKPNQTIFS